VLTKKPIRCSSSGRSRPEDTVPTVTSDWPLHRDSSSCHAATRVMNRVASRACPTRFNRAVTCAGSPKATVAPLFVCTGGRGRSVGRSSVGGSASWVRQ